MVVLLASTVHGQVAAPRFERSIGGVAPKGQLNTPLGVAVSQGADGRIFVVDHGNGRIQAFTGTGSPIGAWGMRGRGPGQFFDPIDIAVSRDGRYVYVVDRGLARVKRFQPDPACFEPSGRDCFNGSAVFEWGYRGTGNGAFGAPTGIAVDAEGNVYVSDWSANDVQKFTDGTFQSRIGSPGHGCGQLMRPTDVEVDAQGRIWVADRDNDRISVFLPDGTHDSDWTAGGKLFKPTGIALDSDGGGFVRDYDPQCRRPRLWRFDSDLNVVGGQRLLGNESMDSSYPLQGVSVPRGGGAVLTDALSFDLSLYMLAPEGEIIRLAGRGTEPDHYDAPTAVAIDQQFYALADMGNHRVLVIDPSQTDHATAVLAAPDYNFAEPRAVAVHRYGPAYPEAVIYIVDPERHMVVLASPEGELLGQWGDGVPRAGGDGMRGPSAVAVSANGDVYIADTLNNRIIHRAAYPDGSVLGEITGEDCPSQLGKLQYPIAVAVGADGTVYTLEQERNRLRAFTADGQCGGVLMDAPSPALPADAEVPAGKLWYPIALSADDKYLYVLENDDLSHMRIQVLTPQVAERTAQVVAVFADKIGPAPGELWQPRGLAASPDGQVLIADTGNNQLDLFRWPGTGPTAEPSRTPTRLPPTPTVTSTTQPTVLPPPDTDTPVPTEPGVGPTEQPKPTETATLRAGRSSVFLPMLVRP